MLCVLKHGLELLVSRKDFFKKSVDKIRSCRRRSIVFALLIIINRLTLCLQGNLFSHLLIFSKSVIFLKKLFKDNHIK